MLLVECMDEDVINGVDKETFQHCFNIFVSVEFEEFDRMDSFSSSNLWACAGCREEW